MALNVPPVQRRTCREDAVREAALILTEYTGYGPRPAYSLARKRVIRWIIRHLWQGRLRKQAGRPALIPSCFSLDEAEGEAWIPNPSDYSRTPEAVLLAEEETDVREACIEQFYDIAYDLVAYRMGLKRCRHVAASNDTAVFQLTLRGNNYAGVAAGLGCSENLAIQRVTYARRRLAAFIEAHGVEVIAAWYREAVEQSRLVDVRAGRDFVAEYVAVQEARYREQYGSEPKRRLREDWRSAARILWAQRSGPGTQHPVFDRAVAVAAD